jgi:exodeoxyribonuclease VII small subunit
MRRSSASVAPVSEQPQRTGSAMARKKVAFDFEQSLAELQQLVERLESGELSLEDSLTCFEQGIGLTRDCQAALSQAEQKVQILLECDGKLQETPFEVDPEA